MSFQQFLLGKISLVLKQCIVTNTDLAIQVVSEDLLHMLDFTVDELRSKKLTYLAGDTEIFNTIPFALSGVFVHRQQIILHDKWNRSVQFFMEAYDIKSTLPFLPLFIFRLIPASSPSVSDKGSTEIDQFVYNMSHDIRGPVATIQGLVGLLKMKAEFTDNDALIRMLEHQSYLLDKRLLDLAYLAKAGVRAGISSNLISISGLEAKIFNLLDSANLNTDSFLFSADRDHISGVNEATLTDLLENLLMFFYHLPVKDINNRQISFHLEIGSEQVALFAEANCIEAGSDALEPIFRTGFVFSDVINNPKLLQFYAAKRIVDRLHGELLPAYRFPDTVLIFCSLPTQRF